VSDASPTHDLLRLVLAVAEGRAAQSVRRIAERVAYVAAYVAVGACCAIGMLGCLVAALWIYARAHVGAVGAPLIVAAALAVVGFAVFALLRYGARARRAPPDAGLSQAALLAEVAGLEELSDLVRAQKGPMLMAALVAGLMAGRNNR
jgi:hypothetical protein